MIITGRFQPDPDGREIPHPMLTASVVDHLAHDNKRKKSLLKWGLRPHAPGIYRLYARIEEAREPLSPSRAIPAAESALRSHPCVAVPSAQVFPAYQLHANLSWRSGGTTTTIAARTARWTTGHRPRLQVYMARARASPFPTAIRQTAHFRIARSQSSLLSLWSDFQARKTGSGGP
jgi:hypothetical protein